MALLSRSTLRTLVRQYADQENGTLCTDTEINTYLGLAFGRFHDLLTDLFEDYDSTLTTSTVAAGSSTIALPSDFLKLRKLELQDSSTASGWRRLDEISLQETNSYSYPFTSSGVVHRAYFIYGDNIRLTPESDASGTYRIWYAKEWAGFPDDSTGTVDDRQGWYEFGVLDAAIRCARKEQMDISELAAQKMQRENEIKAAAAARNVSGPRHILDSWLEDEWGRGSRWWP